MPLKGIDGETKGKKKRKKKTSSSFFSFCCPHLIFLFPIHLSIFTKYISIFGKKKEEKEREKMDETGNSNKCQEVSSSSLRAGKGQKYDIAGNTQVFVGKTIPLSSCLDRHPETDTRFHMHA